jgi:hypothetical protein
MTGPTLPERLRDAGLSAWELGDLLGIHPHLVSGPYPPLTGGRCRSSSRSPAAWTSIPPT